MGNPPPTDRRFDKPASESLVDLINFSNKTYIQYGEIEGDQVAPFAGGALFNTSVRICLAGMSLSGPHSKMTYGRLDIGEYLPEPELFTYDTVADASTLFQQLRDLHHICLDGDDCKIIIGEVSSEGVRSIVFIPKADHYVWTGQLVVKAAMKNHLQRYITERDLLGFSRPQLEL